MNLDFLELTQFKKEKKKRNVTLFKLLHNMSFTSKQMFIKNVTFFPGYIFLKTLFFFLCFKMLNSNLFIPPSNCDLDDLL